MALCQCDIEILVKPCLLISDVTRCAEVFKTRVVSLFADRQDCEYGKSFSLEVEGTGYSKYLLA